MDGIALSPRTSTSPLKLEAKHEKMERQDSVEEMDEEVEIQVDDSETMEIGTEEPKYSLPEYFTQHLSHLEHFRSKGKMTDVTLRGHKLDGSVSPEKLPAHKIILSLNSPYFENLFSGGHQRFSYVVPVQIFVLKKLIAYMYTGKLPILSEETVSAYLIGARLLELETILNLCYSFLKANVSFENFRRIRKMGGLGSEVKESIMAFIYSNLEMFALTKEFLSLEFEEIEEIISYHRNSIASTCKVLNGTETNTETGATETSVAVQIRAETLLKRVLQWVQSDMNGRQKYLFPLMQNVNLTEVPADIMKECMITLSASYQQNSSKIGRNEEQSKNNFATTTAQNEDVDFKFDTTEMQPQFQRENDSVQIPSNILFSINKTKLEPSFSFSSTEASSKEHQKQQKIQNRKKARRLKNIAKDTEKENSGRGSIQHKLQNPVFRHVLVRHTSSSSSSWVSSPEPDIKVRTVTAINSNPNTKPPNKLLRPTPTQNRLLELAQSGSESDVVVAVEPKLLVSINKSPETKQKKVVTVSHGNTIGSINIRRKSLPVAAVTAASPQVLSEIKILTPVTVTTVDSPGNRKRSATGTGTGPIAIKVAPKSDPPNLNQNQRLLGQSTSVTAPKVVTTPQRLSRGQGLRKGQGQTGTSSPVTIAHKIGPIVDLTPRVTVDIERLDLSALRCQKPGDNGPNQSSGSRVKRTPVSSRLKTTSTIRRNNAEKGASSDAPAVKKMRLSTVSPTITTATASTTPVKRTDFVFDASVKVSKSPRVKSQDEAKNTEVSSSSAVAPAVPGPVKEEIVDPPVLQEFVVEDPILTVSPENPLMLFVNVSRGREFSVMVYDFCTKSTAKLMENAAIDRSKFAMVQNGQKLSFIGGRNDDPIFQGYRGRLSMSTILEYKEFPRKSVKGSLQKLVCCSDTPPYSEKCLKEARSECGAVSWKNNIYVVGGRGLAGESLKSAERFDDGLNCWKEMKRMNCGRENFGVSVLNDSIYVVGGWSASNHVPGTALNSVEYFVPEINKWLEAPPMALKRCSVRTAVLNGALYAVGGSSFQDGPKDKYNHFEIYDPRTNRWQSKLRSKGHSLKSARRDAAVAAINGKIYVVGGDDDIFTGLASIETYDPRNAGWYLEGKIEAGGQYSSVAFMNLS